MTRNTNAPPGPEIFTLAGIEQLIFRFEDFIRQKQTGLRLPYLCTTGSLDVLGTIIPCMPRMRYGLKLAPIAAADQTILEKLNDSLHDRVVDFSVAGAAATA